jgi:hypothetical protein
MKDKALTTNLTIEALDVEELERRLELATQAADCGCCGQNGSCNDNKKATSTAEPSC